MKKEVFISYSRLDTDVADSVCRALDRAGISYFIDRQGLGGGMEFPQVLAEAILGCRVFLYLGSANSYSSKFTNSEITYAFNKKERNRIIPYFIDDAPVPAGIEFTFSAINWRHIKTHPIEPNLINDILALLGRPAAANTPESIPDEQKPEPLQPAPVPEDSATPSALFDKSMKGDEDARAELKLRISEGSSLLDDLYALCPIEKLDISTGFKKAEKHYLELLALGYNRAYDLLTILYYTKYDREAFYSFDLHQKAQEMFEANSAPEHLPRAMWCYGRLMTINGDIPSAVRWFEKTIDCAEEDPEAAADACIELGYFYKSGKTGNVLTRRKKAKDLYALGARLGSETAARILRTDFR